MGRHGIEVSTLEFLAAAVDLMNCILLFSIAIIGDQSFEPAKTRSQLFSDRPCNSADIKFISKTP
jgi:hypothetical protein